MHFWDGRQLQLHLQGVTTPVTENGHDISRHAPCNQLLLLLLATVLVQPPRQHALSNQGPVHFGIIGGIDAIIGVVLVHDLGAALGNGLKTRPEVHHTNCCPLVERHRLNLQDMGPPCQAVDLVFSIEGVMYLYCRGSQS